MIFATWTAPHLSLKQMTLNNVMLALAYLFLGRLSLLLAIPPGYAMAIYPPAGLAIAAVLIGGYRLAPGVALGSLLLNLWITWDTQQSLSPVAWLLAVAIALGAMLQAGLGAWLVKKILPMPLELNHHSEIFKFMLLAGPFACLVNASVGISVLVAVGFMPVTAVFSNWITWWGGDSLGVLVVTPIFFVLFAQPRQLWAGRRYSVLLPQLLVLVLMVATYVSVRDWEQDRLAHEFKQRLQSISHTFQAKLRAYLEEQKELASVFENIPHLNAQQFEAIAAPLLRHKAELVAVQWAPKVIQQDRPAFEVLQSHLLQRDFLIRELGQQKTMQMAAAREVYFPLLYIAPFAGNEKAFGFDMYSLPDRRLSIQAAIASNATVATEPLVIVQEKNDKLSVILITAAMQQNRVTDLASEHRQIMENMDVTFGLVVSVLRPSDVLSNLLNVQDKREIKLKLMDVTITASNKVHADVFIDEIGGQKNAAESSQIIEFGGRRWELQARASDHYLAQHRPWAAWISLITGMLFSGLVGMYFLMISGRAFQIESLVTSRTKELQESEENRLAILEHVADGILTVSQDGLILSCNHTAEHSIGLPSERLIGASLDDFFFDEHASAYSFTQLITSANPETRTLIEVQRQRVDGSVISLELAIAKIMQLSQAIYIVVMHDLTERKRVDKIKGEFVSTVSHELRTPLTSIRGSLGLLAGGAVADIPAKAMSLITLANNNAERLHQLINDILDFEKLEYGGMLFKMKPHRLIDQLHKAVEYNAGYAEKFTVKLSVIGEQYADVFVNIDDNRFMQILCNLISNAIKFSHANGVVEIVMERSDDTIRVSVCDHGIGIDAAFTQQIFKKFTQGDSSGTRKHAGTGLGLSLAKSMMEKMGGTIGFSSVSGEGSTFFVDLKIVEIEPSKI